MRDLTTKRTIEELTIIDTGRFGAAIEAERGYQIRKWGGPSLDIHTPAQWGMVLMKEFGEAWAELYKITFDADVIPETFLNLRRELVQVAALCAAMCEELERQR